MNPLNLLADMGSFNISVSETLIVTISTAIFTFTIAIFKWAKNLSDTVLELVAGSKLHMERFEKVYEELREIKKSIVELDNEDRKILLLEKELAFVKEKINDIKNACDDCPIWKYPPPGGG